MALTVTARWPVPRLGGFRDARPALDVWLDVTEWLMDVAGDEADVVVRYGRGGCAPRTAGCARSPGPAERPLHAGP